jgi:hypothetical protein
MMKRADLIDELFRSCDVDGDGILSVEEARLFADFTGFKAGNPEWLEAFNILCSDRNIDPAIGLDKETFTSMINDDDEENACYCANADIVRILLILRCIAKDKASPSKTHCNAGHRLRNRHLGIFEGHVNCSQCRICWQFIPRKEARLSCKDCHYSVCLGCHSGAKLGETCSSVGSNKDAHSDVDSTDVPSTPQTFRSNTFLSDWSTSMRDMQCMQTY